MMGFNKEVDEPNLRDLLDAHKKDIFLSMNCHAIGIIEEFDAAKQTVKARIAYKKTFYEKQGKNYKEVLVDYPFLIDCPAIVLSGGDFSVKMPIKQGDECLVLFNDRSIDKWFESGNVVQLDSNRLHSFSDGIVLVGVRSLARSIEGYEENKVRIGDETHDLILGDGEATLKMDQSIVEVKEKIKIENSSKNLKQLLQDLITAVGAITHDYIDSVGQAATPVTKVTGPPKNASNLQSISNQIGELLE